MKALADVVHIAGCDGGTGASPLSSIKNAGLPWELGLAEAQRALVQSGLRGRAACRRRPEDRGDMMVAALLGADEFSFGTALLLAEGCLMVHSCHLDTCPVGIATQRPELRAKYAATPEQIESYLLFVAEEARALLASLGLRTMAEAVGRVDLLRPRETDDPRAAALNVSPLLGSPLPAATPARRCRRRRRPARRAAHRDAEPALDGPAIVEPVYAIGTEDRAVGARLGGVIGKRFGEGPAAGPHPRALRGLRRAELRRLPRRGGRARADG